ncbi:DNA ligase [Desulfobotulus sp.]|uniref:DNA ligase n=1 Tax=Desulfobotulus sp. TaxID=1940337 RepID=UPI002A366DCA|nr:DNA ligase [Desulfobotulus sp.]MDY0164622.1 DNA ligase [Desulfobotulus sp.]
MKPMLAKPYEDQEVTGWFMSEKLDGVRAIWNGSALISRNGNEFKAPEWFLDSLPKDTFLDGELFMGRSMFQKTVGAVRKQTPVDSEWKQIRYCVFDAPEASGTFEQRMAFLNKTLSQNPIVSVVDHVVCTGVDHLHSLSEKLLALGAEGVMLRRPGSTYENKRSGSLLKFKPLETDEATIIGFQDGEGKHSGRVGAIVCDWKGIVFRLGTGLSDALRETPPRIGELATFAFQGLTDGGVPRFPVFIAARNYE